MKLKLIFNNFASIANHNSFDKNKPTVMYIHGYIENENFPTVKKIVKVFRERNDHNILVCDWGDYSINLYFSVVMPKLKKIGEKISNKLKEFFDAGYNVEKFYLVGHSLGAQASGLIGRRLKSIYGIELERITGLDPAQPGFYPPIYKDFQAISSSDAKFVDIIHTSSTLGVLKSTGTADFYPNANYLTMPGCEIFNPICNHQMSVYYFAESVRKPEIFLAIKADNYEDIENVNADHAETALMGFGCSKNASVKYYLQLDDEEPYGQGRDGIFIEEEDEDDNEEDFFSSLLSIFY
ncbi:hypothetical protein PVAND_004852 [Polypedilum vanderplanki]|uniref:Lipase domain-containing protein n=1 Tax=Polypedilum vanderplanki TaxID=319348 RepID=A0A9J6BZB3_POLVA|nr:hypothetical protein PVAND_004852 [Polypedilum vanderplanki]